MKRSLQFILILAVHLASSLVLAKPFSLRESLRQDFLEPVPSEQRVKDNLERLRNNSRELSVYDEAIRQDPELQAFAQEGQKFIQVYQKMMSEAFGEKDLGLALAPEVEILRRLQPSDHFRRKAPQESVRTEIEARNLALSETANRFRLGQISSSDLEKLRFRDPNGEAIFQFYIGRYRRYLIAPFDRPRPSYDSVRRFKTRMIEDLEQLKARNLLSHFERAKAFGVYQIDTEGPQGPQTLRSNRISNIQVRIETSSREARDRVRWIKIHSLWDRWAHRYGARLKTKDSSAFSENMFQPPKIESNAYPRAIRILFEVDGDSTSGVYNYLFPETEVEKVLNGLRPLNYFGERTDDFILRRFVIEAASRNALYTNAIAFLEETDDRSLEDFRYRLQQRLETLKAGGESLLTLSETIQVNERLWRSESPFVHSIWTGWAIHPDYWNVRKETAERVSLALAQDRRSDGEEEAKSPDLSRKTRKAFKEEARRQEIRQGSDRLRARLRGGNLIRRTTIMAAMAGALWAGYVWNPLQDMDNGTLRAKIEYSIPSAGDAGSRSELLHYLKERWESLKEALSSGKSQTEKSFFKAEDGSEKKSWIDLEFNGKPDFTISDFDSPQNFDIESEAGPPKGGARAADFGWNIPFKVSGTIDRVLYFLVPNEKGPESLPSVFDVIRTKNFTEDLLKNTGFDSRSPDAVLINVPAKAAHSDFSVVTNLPHRAKKMRVSIASPDEASLVGLEVRTTGQTILRAGVDYKVYRLRTNHLMWIQLSERYAGVAVGYKADFKMKESRPPVDSRMTDLKPAGILDLSEKMIQTGIVKLGWALMRGTTSTSSSMTSGLSVSQLQTLFVENATYTYSSKMWQPKGTDTRNPFREFSRFADESGNLFYQCTGSNALFAKFMNEYYRINSLEATFKAENLTAFVRDAEAPVVTLEKGHYRTVIEASQGDGQYVVMDATPYGAQGLSIAQPKALGALKPAYDLNQLGQEPDAEDKKSKESQREIGPFLRPEPPRWRQPEEEKKIEPAEPPPVKESIPAGDQGQLLNDLKELRALKKRLVRFLEGQAMENTWLRKIGERTSVPGLEVNAIARLVENYALGQDTSEAFLEKLVAMRLMFPVEGVHEKSGRGQARARIAQMREQGLSDHEIIEALVSELRGAFLRSLHFVEDSHSEESQQLEFILDQEYRSSVLKILEKLRSSRWAQLQSDYRQMYLECEHLLGTKRETDR